jgi:anti-sigma factor RsiW
MKCRVRARGDEAVLLDYCAGKLDAAAAAALDGHLAVCEDCRRWVEAQRAVWAELDEWVAPPVSAGFDRRLYERLDRDERRAWWCLGRLHLRPALSLAGISVLAVGLLVMRAPQPVLPPEQQALADTVDVDRLEMALDDAEMLRELHMLPSAGPQAM